MLLKTIDSDLIKAIKSGDEIKKNVLRSVKSACKYLQTNQGLAELSDEQVFTIIQKEVKQRKESIETFTLAQRNELVEKEQKELEILLTYLPRQLSEDEITVEIKELLKTNPELSSDFNSSMKLLSSRLKGKADLSVVAKLLKTQLS